MRAHSIHGHTPACVASPGILLNSAWDFSQIGLECGLLIYVGSGALGIQSAAQVDPVDYRLQRQQTAERDTNCGPNMWAHGWLQAQNTAARQVQ